MKKKCRRREQNRQAARTFRQNEKLRIEHLQQVYIIDIIIIDVVVVVIIIIIIIFIIIISSSSSSSSSSIFIIILLLLLLSYNFKYFMSFIYVK